MVARVRFIEVEADQETIRALLADLLDQWQSDAANQPGGGSPSPSLAAAAGDHGAEEIPPPRAAASVNEAKTQASPSASRKAGMLATEEQQRHFRNMHGGGDAKTQAEDRIVKPGDLPAALRSLKVGEEFIIRPAPRHMNGISRHVNRLRAEGVIDRRIAVGRDAEGEVRVIFHREQQT